MLDLYKNIKARREDLGLTQAQLAELTGYADKTMISKIEKGTVDLSQSKIEIFAKALKTTPAKLMGWTQIPTSAFVPEDEMKDAEQDFVNRAKAFADGSAVYYTNPETARIAQEMFDDPEMRSLFHMKRNMDPKKFQAHYDMMKQLYALEHPEDADDFEGC